MKKILLFLLALFPLLVSATDFEIATPGHRPATIMVDTADWKGVRLAAHDLSNDVRRVCGQAAPLTFWSAGLMPAQGSIVAGTLGKSRLIDKMVKAHKIDVRKLRGQWESYLIDVVDGNLVIIGSDKRGTIFGS